MSGRSASRRVGRAWRRASLLPMRARLAGCLFIAVLAAACAATKITGALDLAVLDAQHRFLASHFAKQPARPVALVGIDEETVRQFREPLALWHPHLGAFLQAMAQAGPAAVGLDVVLPDRSFDWLVPGTDRQLLGGLLAARRASKLALAVTLDAGGTARAIHPPFLAVAGQDALGYVVLPVDADNVVRRLPAPTDADGRAVPTLAGRMAAHLGARPSVESTSGGIDYALRPPSRYIPLQQVLAWHAQGDVASLRAAFEGRPVLLGSMLKFEDRHYQPVNLAPWEKENGLLVPGVTIQAQMLATLLADGPVRQAPAAAQAALCVLASLLWLLSLRPPAAIALGALVIAATIAASTALLAQGIRFDIAALLLTIVVALAARWTIDALLEMRERARLRKAFSGYASPNMMQAILDGRLRHEPGGEMRDVCVMFADVRGFTTMSEAASPQAVMAMLNRYFERITQAIHAEDGTINCFMGDGIMAIFGAPQSMDNPSARAFAAARRMLAALAALNRELEAENKRPLSIGIGLNAGPAIVGHVGSRSRHDYSAIGDTTNVAARLEGLTKDLGYPMVCTAAVASALGFPEDLVDLGTQAVKGRSALQVYGWKPPAQESAATSAARTASGVPG